MMHMRIVIDFLIHKKEDIVININQHFHSISSKGEIRS